MCGGVVSLQPLVGLTEKSRLLAAGEGTCNAKSFQGSVVPFFAKMTDSAFGAST